MRWLLILLLVLSGAACHRGTPMTAPTGAAAEDSTLLVLVSGETGAPVAGARLRAGGREYAANDAGQVVVAAHSSELDIDAADYLERQTMLPPSRRLSLWPRRSPTGLDEEATARLVYGCPAPECPGGAQPLARLRKGLAALVPSREIQADRAAMAAFEEAAQRLSDATAGEVALQVVTVGRPGVTTVTATVDGEDPSILSMRAGAVTRREQTSRSEVVRASITFRSLALARRTPLVLHELGHVFGLGHSGHRGDVMWTGPEIYSRADYSARERLTIALMLQRDPGNRYPDDGRGALRARGVEALSTTVISCDVP